MSIIILLVGITSFKFCNSFVSEWVSKVVCLMPRYDKFVMSKHYMDQCEFIYCYITHHTIFNHFSYSALYVFTPFSQVLCDVGRGMQYCKKYTEQELLAESIGRVFVAGIWYYMLQIHPSETPEWCEDMPYKKYVRAVIEMSLKYMSMLTAKPAQ